MGTRGPKPKHEFGFGSITKKGYVRGFDKASGRQRMLHNLVWEQHRGLIPENYQVHHINGIKTDNRIENLELLSPIEHKRLHSGCFRDEQGEWHKPCRKCGIEKHLETNFYKRKDGISPWCKGCCKENVMLNKRKRRAAKRQSALHG